MNRLGGGLPSSLTEQCLSAVLPSIGNSMLDSIRQRTTTIMHDRKALRFTRKRISLGKIDKTLKRFYVARHKRYKIKHSCAAVCWIGPWGRCRGRGTGRPAAIKECGNQGLIVC